MKISLLLLALFFIAATLLPLIRADFWWIRIFDFPRTQIIELGLVVLIAGLFFWEMKEHLYLGVAVVLALALVYQTVKLLPYTPLAAHQVEAVTQHDPDSSLSLLVANVLMENHEADRFLAIVRSRDPDMILTLEPDDWWEEQLQVLEESHPHTIKKPLDNRYGMMLHSRLELKDPEVKYLIRDRIPSFHFKVRLPSGDLIWFHALHPEPPSPTEAEKSTDRDGELLLVGKIVKDRDTPTIVAGDLNDVAWSYSTRLFQKISGLLDPRIGRGMFNTFNAKYFFMRWPLDHVFHSDHFMLVEMERMPAFGSDHFPVFISLQLAPGAETIQEEPDANADEEQEAEEKIEKAERKTESDG